MIYNKGPLTIDEQITQLEKRGLEIKDKYFAESYFINVGYYRLSGYWWSMQSDKIKHIFKPNSNFENVISLYNFDRELRLLLFDIIEKIEIALRTKIVYYLSHELNPWWFEDPTYAKNQSNHNRNLESIDRELSYTKEIFIKQHYIKYSTDSRRPPAWKTLDVQSFGTISKLYGNLSDSINAKDTIAVDFGTVNKSYLPSWLQSIAQIRNICAHHGRIWNKNLPGRPKLLKSPPFDWIINVPLHTDHHKLYIHICCMKYLVDRIDNSNHLAARIKELFAKYPNIDNNALGFTQGWKNEPLWF